MIYIKYNCLYYKENRGIFPYFFIIALFFFVLSGFSQTSDWKSVSYTVEFQTKLMGSNDTIRSVYYFYLQKNNKGDIIKYLIVGEEEVNLYINNNLYEWSSRGGYKIFVENIEITNSDLDKNYLYYISRLKPLIDQNYFKSIESNPYLINSTETIKNNKRLLNYYFDVDDPLLKSYQIHYIYKTENINYPVEIEKFTYFTIEELFQWDYFIYSDLIFDTESQFPLNVDYWLNKFSDYVYFSDEQVVDSLLRNIPQVGAIFKNFVLADFKNDSINLYEKKAKLYLIDFWYSECAPCLLAIPYISELNEKYKDKGLQIYAINPFDKEKLELMEKVINSRGINYLILLSEASYPKNNYGVFSYPTKFLLDENFKIIKVQLGFSEDSMNELKQFIADYLNEE